MACSPLSSDPSFPSAAIRIDAFSHDCTRSPSSTTSSLDPSSDDDDDDSDNDESDEDEDEFNVRVAPHWQAYRYLFESRGYHLDTCKDVRQFYLRYWETGNIQQSTQSCAGYGSACREGRDDNDLCKDEGLVSFFIVGPTSFFLSPLVDWYLALPSGRDLRPLISCSNIPSQFRRR